MLHPCTQMCTLPKVSLNMIFVASYDPNNNTDYLALLVCLGSTAIYSHRHRRPIINEWKDRIMLHYRKLHEL